MYGSHAQFIKKPDTDNKGNKRNNKNLPFAPRFIIAGKFAGAVNLDKIIPKPDELTDKKSEKWNESLITA